MRTPLCDLLGIEHPIVQAPMGGPAVPRLAAAVSNAGALGMLVLGRSDDAGAPVRELRGLTQRSFGANFVLRDDQHERLDAALEAGLAIVSLFWGDPQPYVDQVHDAGALLVHTVGSAEEAKRVVATGADVVVAQGWDAGGHVWGQVGTLSLVPAVVDAVEPTPVIAAGGIGDARGVAAVLALGAQAAWVGTRFLMAEEAPVHEHYRQRLIEAAETDALWFPDLFDGGWPDAPHRALRNATIDAWESAGRPLSGSRPGEGDQIATRSDGTGISRYASSTPLDGMDGDIDAMSLWAGQGVALARRVEPAADIVAELVSRL
jgi:NAD(P)H-dependent flavin oxidoreductase YrpB (nitropropane dioxygenase family)